MTKYYIFFGQDLGKDENCYLNLDIKENIYYIDSRYESKSAKTQFTKQEIELIRKRLKLLSIDDDDVVPVADVDKYFGY